MSDFPVIEFRRYTIVPGQRTAFARYFETLFPEAFQQLRAMALGQFAERDNPDGFIWLRGFRSYEDRAIVNSAFYYGEVWKEHKSTLNGLMTDSDNVLLLRPLHPERGVPVLPAVDPVKESGAAQGVAVAIICTPKPGAMDKFTQLADPSFRRYREAGVRECGVLGTLDVANNFPQLPVRTDGPHLVWLGVAESDAALAAARDTRALVATDLLRAAPEVITLDPTPRSRLRWLR
ncbi:hypothetical protein [Pseudoduganella sp. RAF53_2]|uniref:hypothetical protein n=1 Tax=unclassified Pseudoduganella TaxID=2637179 RepID=UPI003F94F35E